MPINSARPYSRVSVPIAIGTNVRNPRIKMGACKNFNPQYPTRRIPGIKISDIGHYGQTLIRVCQYTQVAELESSLASLPAGRQGARTFGNQACLLAFRQGAPINIGVTAYKSSATPIMDS